MPAAIYSAPREREARAIKRRVAPTATSWESPRAAGIRRENKNARLNSVGRFCVENNAGSDLLCPSRARSASDQETRCPHGNFMGEPASCRHTARKQKRPAEFSRAVLCRE